MSLILTSPLRIEEASDSSASLGGVEVASASHGNFETDADSELDRFEPILATYRKVPKYTGNNIRFLRVIA